MAESPIHEPPPRATRIRAWRAPSGKPAPGGRGYERWRCLPRLIEIDFKELDDNSRACGRRIVARLAAALARERRRARTGHWAYDANRHMALVSAWWAELAMLKPDGRRGEPQPRPQPEGERRRRNSPAGGVACELAPAGPVEV